MSDTKKQGTSRGRAFTTDAKAAVMERPDVHEPVVENVPVVQTGGALTVNAYADYAGAGMEDVSSSEMLIPFLRIVQPTANVLKETDPSYDDSVKKGMIFNTATGLYVSRDVGFGFVPTNRQASYNEWVPISAGGGSGSGFRGVWDHDDPRIAPMLKQQGAFKPLNTGQGTELIETFTIYGAAVPIVDGVWHNDEAMAAVISFSSTQIKKYKMWVTRLQALTGAPRPKYPMFAWRWHLTTQPEFNAKGAFYGWRIGLVADTADGARLAPNDGLFQMAAEIHNLVKSGAAKVDFAQSGGAAEPSGGDVDHTKGQTIDQSRVDEEIPF